MYVRFFLFACIFFLANFGRFRKIKYTQNFLFGGIRENKYSFQLTKYEYKDVRESIDSSNTNLSSIGFAE